MQIQVAEVAIEVQKKNIKNMHLRVKPPWGRVVISAPLRVPNRTIELFARSNLPWVRRQIEKFRTRAPETKRQYVSGEQIFLWGESYGIVVIESAKPAYKIMGDKILLYRGVAGEVYAGGLSGRAYKAGRSAYAEVGSTHWP